MWTRRRLLPAFVVVAIAEFKSPSKSAARCSRIFEFCRNSTQCCNGMRCYEHRCCSDWPCVCYAEGSICQEDKDCCSRRCNRDNDVLGDEYGTCRPLRPRR